MNSTNYPIVIPLSKTKLFFAFIGSILFTGFGYFMYAYLPEMQNKYNPGYVMILGMISMVFFGLFALFHLKQLFNSGPGFKIDTEGITDHSGPNGIGLIEWKDITDIKIHKIKSTKLLVVTVKNPDFYVERATSPISRKLMQMNHGLTGSPINISSNSLKCSFSELENWIRKGWENSKK